jgi:hypothetical protein
MASSSTAASASIDCKINIPIEIFNKHFTCPLCLGYFRDPYVSILSLTRRIYYIKYLNNTINCMRLLTNSLLYWNVNLSRLSRNAE